MTKVKATANQMSSTGMTEIMGARLGWMMGNSAL